MAWKRPLEGHVMRNLEQIYVDLESMCTGGKIILQARSASIRSIVMSAALFKAACHCRGALPRRAPVVFHWRGSRKLSGGLKPNPFSEIPGTCVAIEI